MFVMPLLTFPRCSNSQSSAAFCLSKLLSFIRALCSCDLEVPATQPNIRAISSCPARMEVDMSRFAEDKNLTSWAGMCPGNNESACKRKSGKTRKRNRYLRAALIQAAWAASHQKETYLAAQYHRLVKRKGKPRALVAVGHSILVIVSKLHASRTTDSTALNHRACTVICLLC